VSTAVDWNTTHLFNPAWHPHARFHDALFLLILDATSLVILWLLWRPSKEPEIGLRVAALFSAAVWSFLYRGADSRYQPTGSLQCAGPEGGGHDLCAESHHCRVLFLLTVIADAPAAGRGAGARRRAPSHLRE
jgi:hypothetical protein